MEMQKGLRAIPWKNSERATQWPRSHGSRIAGAKRFGSPTKEQGGFADDGMTQERQKAWLLLLAILCGGVSFALFRLDNARLVESGAIQASLAQKEVEMEIFAYLHDHPDITHTSVIRLQEIDTLSKKAEELRREEKNIPNRHPGETCTEAFGTCVGFEDQAAALNLMKEAEAVSGKANELSTELVHENYRYLQGTSGQKLFDEYAEIRSDVNGMKDSLSYFGMRLSEWALLPFLLIAFLVWKFFN